MKYKTKVTLECSYGLGQAWEVQEAIVEHEVVLNYPEMFKMAIKAIGGAYITYGAMTAVSAGEEI